MINTSLLPVAILAGGLGTRIKPLTEKIPKALIEINSEPFIAHQLRLLKNKGIQRVVICAGYLGEMIAAFVGDGQQFGLTVQYSYDGEQLLGTAGALKKALPLLGENFFVLYGDSYLPCDFNKAQAVFLESSKLGLMTVYKNNDLGDKSNVEFKAGQIIQYDKQDITTAMQYIDYGLGIFAGKAFNEIPDNSNFDLATLYQKLLREKQLAAFEVHERFYEIGSFNGINELSHHLQV